MANPVTMITSSPTTTAQMTSSSLSGVVGSASQVVNQGDSVILMDVAGSSNSEM